MNILQILPELKVGGVETGTVDLARELVKRGHKAVVVSNGGPLVDMLERSGAKHYQLPVHRKSPIAVMKTIGKLVDIIKEEQIEVVHARSRVPAIIAFFACRRIAIRDGLFSREGGYPRPKFVTTCHGYYSKHLFSRPMGWGRFVIVSSQAVARHMAEDFGVPLERIRLLPRGVDLEKFRFRKISTSKDKRINSAQEMRRDFAPIPGNRLHRQETLPISRDKPASSPEFTIGMIGRLTPLKGHPFFIKAVSKVVRVIPRVKVLIVGEAPRGKENYKGELQLLVRRLGLSKYVEFLGGRYDIPKVLGRLDLLILATTTQEAFGRVILEAAAAGVPVVATRVGGVVDIITHRKEGLLVEPGDPQGMFESIVEILKDPELAQRLALKARGKIEAKFSLHAMVEKTLKVYQQAIQRFRILVIKIGAVGDVVLAIPSLRALRERFPNAHISCLVGLESREILQRCPYIDDIIVYNRKVSRSVGFRYFLRLTGRLKSSDFDLVVDLQNSARSHILGFLSLAPIRLGYHNRKLGFLLNYGVKDVGIPMPPVDHQFRVLGLLGINLDNDRLELWPQGREHDYIKDFLSAHWVKADEPLVGINPGGSARWITKRWPLQKFATFCDELAQRNIRTVITGGKDDQDLARNLALLAKSKPINAAGKTSLMEMAALMKRCQVFVTGDSAPMHIAAAMGTPLVVLFGPTDPRRHIPPGDKYLIIRKDIKCSPCYKATCINPVCMGDITVEEVLQALTCLRTRNGSTEV